MARLDRMPEVKEVAQIAACIGREFDYACSPPSPTGRSPSSGGPRPAGQPPS